MYAHSLPGKPVESWEPLGHHFLAVCARAEAHGAAFGLGQVARAAGLLHDLGKTSPAFQAYIAQPTAPGARRRGPDHASAGAKAALATYHPSIGRMLAIAIAAHHAGLPDGAQLRDRLASDYPVAQDWHRLTGPLPAASAMRAPPGFRFQRHAGFSKAFLNRMLFSCLVDADFLETEAFYAAANGQPVERGGFASLAVLRERLRSHMAGLRQDAAPAMAALRQGVLNHALGRAALPPGLFTLTVPTGGGKTLASLSFALEHALRHGLRRVVYVIPFTSIIEQTAAVFREALDTQADVLEHHSSFDWDNAARSADEEAQEGREALAKLRKAAENWEAPIVVTTAVQFFESLFAHRPSRCRKLHNLARAVIVLDEAQMLPLPVLRPCMAALEELATNYGSSVVLCTATQPALRLQDTFAGGLDIPPDRELARDPPALYRALKRVRVAVLATPTPDPVVAARFAEQPQMLCIVNSRRHARELFDTIRGMPGATHLSTLMCPRHRRAVLARVRERLAVGEPVRLVSTSLIEAGVDISFPEVWRAAAGLDSVAQAAGRCNRHGLLPEGRVVVFTPADERHKPPKELNDFWQAARPVLATHGEDPLGLEAVRAYFRELYWQKGAEALDRLEIDGQRGILAAHARHDREGDFPFRSIGEAFRLIEDSMQPVLVPYDTDGEALFRTLGAMERPLADQLRQAQQYVVTIPSRDRAFWLAQGVLRPLHPALGDALLAFPDLAHYREETGLDVAAPGLRGAADNVV